MWMRVLVLLAERVPGLPLAEVCELGSSDSIGIGIMALLTGSDRYTSLELSGRPNRDEMLEMLHELTDLLSSHAPIPDEVEFPKINIRLSCYDFPHALLPNTKLRAMLDETRILHIHESINRLSSGARDCDQIRFICPWHDKLVEKQEDFDLIFSRAVMEHVNDCRKVYSALAERLKTGGLMLHDIEYHGHSASRIWNGHWCYPNWLWSLLKGNRPMMINRATHEMHREYLKQAGIFIKDDARTIRSSTVSVNCLSRDFRDISAEDLQTYGGWILGLKDQKITKTETA